MSAKGSRPYSFEDNSSEFPKSLNISKRSKLHTLSTNSWLKTRHSETTTLSYLCFPNEKEQHRMISEIFGLFDKKQQNNIKINELVKIIYRFQTKIPKKFLWSFFHRHDLDKDQALNFEEFKACALSTHGKFIFSNLVEKLKNKKSNNLTKIDCMPTSFDSLIKKVSYLSTRNDLLKQVSDVSLDINRRANHFFKLFELQNKYKNSEHIDPENCKQKCFNQNSNEFDDIIKTKIILPEITDMSLSDSVLKSQKFIQIFNDSKFSNDKEPPEEIADIINESKSKVEEFLNDFKEKNEEEINGSLQTLNFDKKDDYHTFLEKPEKKVNKIESKKKGRIEKIMIEHLKECKKSKANKLFKTLIGAENSIEKIKRRQIKFFPLQINDKVKFSDHDNVLKDKILKNIAFKDEFELFLPKIEKMKNPLPATNLVKKLPTINIFNEDYGFNKKNKGKLSYYQ